jgi:hypothetical protein
VSVFVPSTTGTLIVCPTAQANGGLYIDRQPSAYLPGDVMPEDLGQSVWQALLCFRSISGPLDLSSRKKTDWPAYRASGAKSVRQFEDCFVRVSVEAFPCLLRIEAGVLAKVAERLFVGGYLSNACQFEALGELIQLVCRGSLLIAEHEYS